MNTATKLMLGLLGGRRAFSPLSIPGLALWLDASDSTTLFQDSAGTTPATADNDVIGRWADKSGNGRNVTQGTTANKPVLKLATQNGKNVVQFDGNDQLTGALTASQPVTIFAVVKSAAARPSQSGVVAPNGNCGIYAHYAGTWVLYSAGAANLSGAAITTQFSVVSAVANGGSSFIRVNAVQANGTVGTTGVGGMAIGNLLIGSIAETLVWPSQLSGAQIATVETYLNTKWGAY